MPIGSEPPLLNKYFNEEPYTQILTTNEFLTKKNKKVLITQYFKVKTSNDIYDKERQKEIDSCLEINSRNENLDEIHLLTEAEHDLSFIPTQFMYKIKQTVIGKRLEYQTAFDYYNEHLSCYTCILTNADIFTDNSIGLLDYINLDNTVLALTRYEFNDEESAIFLYGSEEKSRSPRFYNDYEPIIGSQDAWIWNMSKIEVSNSGFCLGIHGCDNRIATIIIDSGYNMYNPSYLISVSHYDRLGTEVIKGDKRKGLISLKRDPPPADSFLYKTFLENTHEIVDRYTKRAIYTNKITSEEPYWQPKYFITMSKQTRIIDLPYASSTQNQEYAEYSFNHICSIRIIDIQGNFDKINKKEMAYVSRFKISYCLNNIWVEYHEILNGLQKPYVGFIKRNYITEPFSCIKLRIHILDYVGKPETNVKFFGLRHDINTITENTALITLTNTGYTDYTLNCFESLKNIKFHKPLTAYCIGKEGHDKLEKNGYMSTLIDNDGANSEFQLYRTGKWSNVVFNKFKIIYDNLITHDYVCYTDGDIVFEDNAWFNYLLENIENNDILIQDNTNNGNTFLCSGFMFIKSSKTTIELFDPVNTEPFKETIGWGDQIYINEIIDKLKYKRLPLDLFPNGGFYYSNYKEITPYIIHFNWVKGHEKKEKLKYHSKWYLN